MQGKNPLKKFKMFKDVSHSTLDWLWHAGRVEEFKKGSLLMRAKEPIRSVCIQLTGKSMVYNLTCAGRRKIIFIFGSGVLLNEHVQNFQLTSCYCETIETSRIFVIPVSRFLYGMEQDFTLVKAVLTIQEWKAWRLCHQLKNTMGSIGLEKKLAAKLWKLSRDFGKRTPEGIEIDINMPVTFLADILGAPRETTSRLCNQLSGYGLIKMEKKRITILDSDRMAVFFKTGKIE